MLQINVHFNPLTDTIDLEATKKRMDYLHSNYHYPMCSKHPDFESEVAFKVSGNKDWAAPIKFCCHEYQLLIMEDINQFLYNHPFP